MSESTSHQQLLQVLHEGLAVGCNSNTQRLKKKAGKDSGKGDLKHRNTPSDDEIMSPSQYTTLFMFLAIK